LKEGSLRRGRQVLCYGHRYGHETPDVRSLLEIHDKNMQHRSSHGSQGRDELIEYDESHFERDRGGEDS
jgi:hypothetical protein